jgi:hypothetical protein
MLLESHTLLCSVECYLRVTHYCPVLNVAWKSRFFVQCWMLPEGHAFLSSAECYLRVTLYCRLLNATWVILYCPVLMLPQSDSLLSSAECYLKVTLYCPVLNITWESHLILLSIAECWAASEVIKSWSRLSINSHVNVCYQYCHVKCPHNISYN